MNEYTVYVNGERVHRYRHTEQLTFEQWPDAVQEIVPVEPEPHPPEPLKPRVVSKFAFRSRFTPAEKVAIEFASLDDPTATPAKRSIAASLRVLQADLEAATFVDLELPSTRNGVQMLEQVGLIGPGRAAEILDAPVSDWERWNG